MRGLRSILGVLTATLLLTTVLGGAATAKGVVWCVRDPIFVVDGRTVQVQDLVPTENATTPIHFVLFVSEASQVSWRLPEGEILYGSVAIVADRAVSRDTPLLWVRGEGPSFPMRLNVSGSGLRSLPYEIAGTSRGMIVSLRLLALSASDSDDD